MEIEKNPYRDRCVVVVDWNPLVVADWASPRATAPAVEYRQRPRRRWRREAGGGFQARDARRARRSRSPRSAAKWYFSTYGQPGAGRAARRCPRWRRCTKNSSSNKDFVMLAVSQDTKGSRRSCRTCRRTDTVQGPARSGQQGRRSLRCQRGSGDIHNRSRRPHRGASYGGVRLVASRDAREALKQLINSSGKRRAVRNDRRGRGRMHRTPLLFK